MGMVEGDCKRKNLEDYGILGGYTMKIAKQISTWHIFMVV